MIDANRTPPHDLVAEANVIGCVLLGAATATALVSDLRPDDFFDTCHREAWAAILALVDRTVPVDVLSLGDELKARGVAARFDGGWHAWATRIAGGVSSWQNVQHHALMVREKATLRRLLALAVDVACRCYTGERVAEVLGGARDGVAALEVDGYEGGPVKIGDALSDSIEVIQSRAKGRVSEHMVLTGIETLDYEIGGMAPEEVVVVAGRPGHGKTAFADCVAVNCGLADVPCLFFSLEMSLQQLVERVLSMRSQIPASYLRSGRGEGYKPLDKEAFKKLNAASNELYNVPLWIDPRSLPLSRIVGESRRWHARHVRGKGKKLALIAIDYLQLIDVETQRRGGNREEAVGQISKTVKRLAKDLGIPLMPMSQLNRKIEERGGEPQMSDIRESGAIEQDASIILCPWRGEMASDPERKNHDCDAEIIILKNRGGQTGKAPVKWLAKTMEFRHDWSRTKSGRPDDFGGECSLIDDYQITPPSSPPGDWQNRDRE